MTTRFLTGSLWAVTIAACTMGCSSQGMSNPGGGDMSAGGDEPRYLTGDQPFDQVMTINSYGTDESRQLLLVLTDHAALPQAAWADYSTDALTDLVCTHAPAAVREVDKTTYPDIDVTFFIRREGGDPTLGRTVTFSIDQLNELCNKSPAEAHQFVADQARNWPEMHLPDREDRD